MDFSKVKKLVIPEGEVQSITIADKVVWTKPQDKKWNVILPKGTFTSSFAYYVDTVRNIGTCDLKKSKLLRYTIWNSSGTIYHGVDKIISSSAQDGTYDISLEAEGASTYQQTIITEYRYDSDYSFNGGAEIYIDCKTGEIKFRYYSNRSYPYQISFTIEIEQFY